MDMAVSRSLSTCFVTSGSSLFRWQVRSHPTHNVSRRCARGEDGNPIVRQNCDVTIADDASAKHHNRFCVSAVQPLTHLF